MEQNRHEKAAKRKPRFWAEEIRRHLQEQVKSGLSIKDYCKANGISEKNFYRWTYRRRKHPVKRLRKKKRAQAGFAKIELLQSGAIPDKAFHYSTISNHHYVLLRDDAKKRTQRTEMSCTFDFLSGYLRQWYSGSMMDFEIIVRSRRTISQLI